MALASPFAYIDEYGQTAAPRPAAPTANISSTPPGYIGGPGQVAPPVFSPGPGLGSINLDNLFKNAGGGGNVPVVTDTHSQDVGTFQGDQILPSSLTNLGASQQAPAFSFNSSSDPGVLASLALEQQGLGSLDAALKAARERAIINFGDPSLADEAGFGLDPQAGAFARQNYLSGNAATARIDKAHQLARQAVINRLVSKGLLQSGDLGYGEGQEDQNYGNQLYDAKQQVLDYLANLFSQYNDKRQQLSQNTLNARLQAIQNFLGNPDAYAGLYG